MRLRTVALEGFRYQFYVRIVNIVLYQASALILAILLLPHDFAVVGLAMIFVGFALNVSDLGISPALIQREESELRGLDTGISLRFIFALALTAILVALAPHIADLYGEPSLMTIVWALSPLVLLNFFAFPARLALTKTLRFRRIFLPDAIGSGAAAVASVAMAFSGFSYWSLILGQVFGAAVGVILLFRVSPWRPRWALERSDAAELMRFGLPLTVAGVLFFLFQNAGIAILARASLVDVGYFLFAYTWSVSVYLGLQASLDNVLFPVMSAMNKDVARLRKSFLAYLEYLSWAIVPLGAFVGAAAPSFVLSLVGTKWSASVAILQILAPAGVVMVLSLAYHSLALALGRPKEILYYNGVGVACLVPTAIIFVTLGGSVGLAWAFLVTAAVLFGWAVWRCQALFIARGSEFLGSLIAPVGASLVFAVPLALVQPVLTGTVSTLVAELLASIGVYCAAMILFTRKRFLADAAALLASVLRG